MKLTFCRSTFIQIAGSNLPNEGKLTFHDDGDFSLISGSKVEWNVALRFMVPALRRAKDMEDFDRIFMTFLRKRATTLDDVSQGYGYIGISRVDCERYPSHIKAVKFYGPEKGDCVLGGWLESELKSRYGTNTQFSLRFIESPEFQLDASATADPSINYYEFRDPHSTHFYDLMTRDNLQHVEVRVENKVLGRLPDVFEANRARAALMFMDRLDHQCAPL